MTLCGNDCEAIKGALHLLELTQMSPDVSNWQRLMENAKWVFASWCSGRLVRWRLIDKWESLSTLVTVHWLVQDMSRNINLSCGDPVHGGSCASLNSGKYATIRLLVHGRTAKRIEFAKIYNFDDIISRRTCSNSMRDYISILFVCPLRCYSILPPDGARSKKTEAIHSRQALLIEQTSQTFMIYISVMGEVLKSENLKQIHHADDWSILLCCWAKHFCRKFCADKYFN